MMEKEFTINMNRKWIDILDKITNQYFYKVHSRTKNKPVDLFNGKEVLPAEMEHVDNSKPKFKIGDRVRISYKRRPTFDKAYLPNWTWEIFIVTDVNKTNPITYKL